MTTMMELPDAASLVLGDMLTLDELLAMLELSRVMVLSPLRQRCFARLAWRVPPSEALAFKLLANGSMTRFIRTVVVSEAWQQPLLQLLPSLETVYFESDHKSVMLIHRELPKKIKHLDMSKCSSATIDGGIREPSAWEGCYRRLKTLVLPEKFDAPRGLHVSELLELKKFAVADRWGMKVLPRLTNLRSLCLSGNFVELKALAGLIHLEELEIKLYQIPSVDDLIVIAPGLKKLDLSSSDFSPSISIQQKYQLVSSLQSVQNLRLPTHDIVDCVTPFVALTEIQHLYLCAPPDADLSPLAALTNLQSLDVEEGLDLLSSASQKALEKLPMLTTLRSGMHSATVLTRFQFLHLKELTLVNRETVAISFNIVYPCVERLIIQTSKVDLENINKCFPTLIRLKLVGVDKSDGLDLNPIGNLTRLTHLSLSVNGGVPYGSDIQDLDYSFLLRLPSLESLEIHDPYPAPGVHLFNYITRIRRLVLKTPIHTISFVANQQLLRELDIRRTQVKDLSSLRGHPRLSHLVIPAEADCSSLFNDNGDPVLPSIKKIVHGYEPRCLWRHGFTNVKAPCEWLKALQAKTVSTAL